MASWRTRWSPNNLDMPKIEKVVGRVDGVLQETEVSVMRRIRITADCSCWNHRAVEFELIVPGGGKKHEREAVYIRSGNTEHFYRNADRNGPIDIRIDTVTSE